MQNSAIAVSYKGGERGFNLEYAEALQDAFHSITWAIVDDGVGFIAIWILGTATAITAVIRVIVRRRAVPLRRYSDVET